MHSTPLAVDHLEKLIILHKFRAHAYDALPNFHIAFKSVLLCKRKRLGFGDAITNWFVKDVCIDRKCFD